jgi:hypothetical protein
VNKVAQWVLRNCRFAEPQAPAPTQPVMIPYDGKSDDETINTYFNLGHGEENDYSYEPLSHQVWVLRQGRIDARPASSGTHGSIWGHDFADKTWKGRFEGDSGRLSVVAPEKGMQMPGMLLGKLRAEFGDIVEVHLF